jgi:hypothetical protein
VIPIYRVRQDQHYAYLWVAEDDRAAFEEMMPIHLSARGVPLKSIWNEDWELTVIEDEDDIDHLGGVGDFADMNKLIATNAKGRKLLRPLLGEAAEELRATFQGRDVWLFNVIRRVDRKDLGQLETGAVFRINPVGLDILCGPDFKQAIERSGLSGLTFTRVDPDDQYGMV